MCCDPFWTRHVREHRLDLPCILVLVTLPFLLLHALPSPQVSNLETSTRCNIQYMCQVFITDLRWLFDFDYMRRVSYIHVLRSSNALLCFIVIHQYTSYIHIQARSMLNSSYLSYKQILHFEMILVMKNKCYKMWHFEFNWGET